jgi:hypothetical protein
MKCLEISSRVFLLQKITGVIVIKPGTLAKTLAAEAVLVEQSAKLLETSQLEKLLPSKLVMNIHGREDFEASDIFLLQMLVKQS